MKSLLNKRWKIWIFSPLCFGIILMLHFFNTKKDTLPQLATKIERQLNERLAVIKSYEQQLNIENKLNKNCQNEYIAIYHKDSLFYWTDNNAVLKDYCCYKEGVSFQQFGSGDYILYKSIDTLSANTFVALIPLHENYEVHNTFLSQKWIINELKNVPLDFTAYSDSGSLPLKLYPENQVLCYISLASEDRSLMNSGVEPNYKLIVAYILLLIILLYSWNDLVRSIAIASSHQFALAIYIGSLALVFYFMTTFQFPNFIFQTALFNPDNYASTRFFDSLGKTFLFVLFICGIIFYAYFFFPSIFRFQKNKRLYLVYILLLSSLFQVITYIGLILIRSFNEDSNIPLSNYNIHDFNEYTLFCYSTIALLLIANFLLIKSVIKCWLTNRLPFWGFALIQLLILLSFIVIEKVVYHNDLLLQWGYYPIVFYLITFWIYDFLKHRSLLVFYFIGLLYLAFSAAGCINYYAIVKENENRKHVAEKLLKDRDPITEYLFSEFQSKLESDEYLHAFISKSSSAEFLQNYLNQKYFKGYFHKYNVWFIVTDPNNAILLNTADENKVPDLDSLLYNNDSLNTKPKLQFISKEYGQSYYGIKLPIVHQNTLTGHLFVFLIPPSKVIQNVYPELLMEDKVKAQLVNDIYDYAIYKNKKLVAQCGDYPYNLEFDGTYFKDKEFSFLNSSNYSHLIYRASNNDIVIVSIRQTPLFTYLSITCGVLLLIGIFLAVLFFVFRTKRMTNLVFDVSISNKIFFATITLIFLLITSIGIMMAIYFKSQFNTILKERLTRRIVLIPNQINLNLVSEKQNADTLSIAELNDRIQRLAYLNELDLNVFNAKGEIIATSQPLIFEKGLQSYQMNFEAFQAMINDKKALLIQNEQVGSLSFLSAYVPVEINGLNGQYFVNIPYFAKQKELAHSMSTFLLMLANVYVLFILLALLLTYFLSGNITRSFSIIRNKMKAIQLGGKNEVIEWKQDDEIGALITEYNRMIQQLDESALLLARNERESAWREMSRQVAHEIKNPLTPMKLSIQLLQRAIADNRPDIQDLTKKVSNTLVEQIDNLAQIASQFSQFSKISQVEASVNDLRTIIQTAVELYKHHRDNVTIQFELPSTPVNVFVDRNQFISVFNNLILNAIQAIPEEQEGLVQLALTTANQWAIVQITDNGSGIEPEKLEKIFEPNFTTKTSGTGLGLAIARAIITNAEGHISVSSELAKFTTFKIELKLVNSSIKTLKDENEKYTPGN